MSAKFLNLDELTTPKKVLTLNGKTHEMKEVSVGEFIEVVKEAEKLEQQKLTISDQVQITVDSIQRAFPTIEREELEALKFDQLTAVFKFIQDELETGAEEAGVEKKS